MSQPHGHGFRATGFVHRAFVPQSGKVAFLTIAVPGKQKEQKIEMRTFDGEMIRRVGGLAVGEEVTVTAGVESTKLTNKAKQHVEIDGRAAWILALTIRTLEVEEKAKPDSAAPKGMSVGEQSKVDGVDW